MLGQPRTNRRPGREDDHGDHDPWVPFLLASDKRRDPHLDIERAKKRHERQCHTRTQGIDERTDGVELEVAEFSSLEVHEGGARPASARGQVDLAPSAPMPQAPHRSTNLLVAHGQFEGGAPVLTSPLRDDFLALSGTKRFAM